MKFSSGHSQPSSENNCETCLRLCQFITVAAKIVFYAIIILLILLIISDAYLRLKGKKPIPLAARGLSQTIPDSWTSWTNRPNVAGDNEYTRANSYGLHDDKEYSLLKVGKNPRIAVVGSSVVWGPGQPFKDTIPRALDEVLQAKGCHAEVMNFGFPGFNLVNTSALMQTKVHQFQPDVVVLILDVQELFPRWPSVVPAEVQSSIKQLAWYELLFKRASEYNVLLSSLDDPVSIQQAIEKKIKLPLTEPVLPIKAITSTDSKNVLVSKESVISIEDYEAKRRKELNAVIAAVTSFYKEINIPLYIMTPYGPYFNFSDAELAGFSLNMMDEAAQVYGSLAAALPKQIIFSTELIAKKSQQNGAHVINMLQASEKSQSLKNPDFSTDAIHFTGKGNRHVGEIIADRLMADGICKG